MTFKEKREIKKIVEKIDKGIKVKFGRNFECDIDKKIVYVAKKHNLQNDEMFKNWYEKFFDTTLNEKDLFLISLLHEVGHIQTYTEELDNERDEMWSVTAIALNLGIIDIIQANNEYFEIPMELIATKWGKNYFEKFLKKA